MTPIANHLWQSTVFAAAAALLALALRHNRAQVRYWLWLTASIKFLVPFSLLVTTAGRLGGPAPASLPPQVSAAISQVNQTFAPIGGADAVIAIPAAKGPAVPVLVVALWLSGCAILLAYWTLRWRRLRAAARSASPLDLHSPIPVMSSRTLIEPGVFGIFRPVLLLPEGIWNRLAPEQFSAILAHEFCHVRRRDNLASAIHMVVEAVFWFHPLVWWIGARMVDERERACDEEVVRQGTEPHVYAEGILSVCKFYLQSRLACASGVTGADLKKRIEAIVANRIAPRLTAARKMLLAAAGMAAIGAPVLIGLWRAPSGNAQSQEKLVFEVASIKRVDPAAQGGGPIPLAPGLTPDGGIRSRVPIFNLICWAYRIDGSQLSGGPSWVRSDRYAIEAKPEKFEGPEDPTVPISEQQANRTRERVKALLADRFHMAVRTETKEAAVYVLSVAKGGHKLTPNPEGVGGVSRGAGVIESPLGAPISFLVVSLTLELGRPVLDETGLDGRFKFKLEFRPEGADVKRALALAGEPIADDDPRPSIFTAIKSQLGLELQSRKGPVTAVAIERIERPTEN